MKTELILLAAGQSKRFGGIKQLANICGQPMVCYCLSQYRKGEEWVSGIAEGHIILGSNAALVTQVLPENVNRYVVNSWLNGMGHSLAKSIQNIAGDTSHVLIGLGDQIALTQQMISKLLDEAKKHPEHIIAAKYEDRVGAPAVFPRQYFSELSRLTGDKGAKSILQQYPQQVISMDIPEAAFDIDTPDDLKHIKTVLNFL